MSRFLVEDVNRKDTIGDDLLGDLGGSTVIEIKLRNEENEIFFLRVQETFDVPFFYLSDRSFFDADSDDCDDQDLSDDLDKSMFSEPEVKFESVFRSPDYPYYSPLRYLIYLLSTEEEEAGRFIRETRGTWIEDSQIPRTEYENEYIEMIEEE